MEGVSPVFHPSSDSTIPSSKATTPQLRTPEDTGVDQTPLRIPKRQPTLSELPPPAQRKKQDTGVVDNANESCYPSAAEHQDPMVKVVPSDRGKGKRPTVLLWQRYGKKALYKKVTIPTGPMDWSIGDQGDAQRVERMYFKCYSAGCKARLRVDMDLVTGEQIHASAAGVHNHAVELSMMPTSVGSRASLPEKPSLGRHNPVHDCTST
eukprot:TRINITY_DN25721_c0_g1_i1.p1 TRINITY_DN25721_c0_g1~~TRINITY_DN25721_c0_g1_i1.p1  ORF type:complete len:208 (+),score=44.32 TRINITY_DN25721_c0_g1_i1:149-772(+)